MPAFYQSIYGNTGGATNPTGITPAGSLLLPDRGGNCIIVDILWIPASGSTGTFSLSDSAGNTYTRIFQDVFGDVGGGVEIAESWIAENIAPYDSGGSEPGVAVSAAYAPVSGSSYFTAGSMAIHEYSGVPRSTVVDTFSTEWHEGFVHGIISSGVSLSGVSIPLLVHAFMGAPNDFEPTFADYASLPFPGWNQRQIATEYGGPSAPATVLVSFDAQEAPYTPVAFAAKTAHGPALFVGIIAIVGAAQPVPGQPGSIPDAWLVIGESAALNPNGVPGYYDRSTYLFTGQNGAGNHLWASTLNQRGTAEIPLRILPGDTYASDPNDIEGVQVFLYDIVVNVQTLVWAGTVEKTRLQFEGASGFHLLILTCTSFDQCFDTLKIPPQTFFSQTAGAIFTALFNQVAAGVPLTLGDVSGGTGTGANFTVDIFDLAEPPWQTLSEAFRNLAISAQAVWGIDLATLSVYFHLPSVAPAPYTVESDNLAFDSSAYQLDRNDYRNRQIIRIAQSAFADSDELFAVGGFRTQFSVVLRNPVKTVTAAFLTPLTQNFATGALTSSSNFSPGDTVTIGYPQTGSLYNWSPNSPYSVGQIIIDSRGNVQQVQIAGTSGSDQSLITPPFFNASIGGTSSDGPGSPQLPGFASGVIWKNLGPSGAGGLGGSIYTAVTQANLDNTQYGQFVIGGTPQQSIKNLIDAINQNSFVQGQTFSWPTWENPLVNAQIGSDALHLKVVNKVAGLLDIAALFTTSAAFTWSASQTGGATTTSQSTIALTVSQQGSSNTANLYYTPGQPAVSLASIPSGLSNPLPNPFYLQVQYQRIGSDCIIVENTQQVAIRAAIEQGTGKYQQLYSDTNLTSTTQALAYAQAILAAYDSIPVSLSFKVWKPGLQPGDLITLSLSGSATPSLLAALVNGTWVVQEVQAELVPGTEPWMDQSVVPGGGHYEYTITVVNDSQVLSYLAFWEQLAGTSASGTTPGIIGSLAPGGATGIIIAGAAAYEIPGGSPFTGFTPDFSQSNIQCIVLGYDANLYQPTSLPAGSFSWLLYVDNPTGATCSLVPDSTYAAGAAISVAAGTRTIISCTTTQSGNTVFSNIVDNQPILPI